MNDDRSRCLELLGLKPGASAQEIKAAYRDMAKVWHPDRFSHDPRLQEKAQNKLKEINEAYEALTSGNFNRSNRAANSSNNPAGSPSHPASPPTGSEQSWLMLMILIACVAAAGFILVPKLLPRATSETKQASTINQSGEEEENSKASVKDESSTLRQERKSAEKQKAPATILPNSAPAASHAPLRPLPTVTMTIDPSTGLLATAACPNKSSLTYPAGQEPHSYCNADHRSNTKAEAQPETKGKSRLKSIANGLASPARWLHKKTKDSEP